MLKIIPLGGLGEIGLNMMVFEFEHNLLVVDAGLMFPEDYMLGIDYVIPDMSYLRENRQKIVGIVLTHAHEDHIGAVPFLLREMDIPVYGTGFTLGMLSHKLEEQGLLETALLHEIRPSQQLALGAFTLEFIRVAHSVVDGIGIAIHTPVGLVVHTGDFKIGYNPVSGSTSDLGRFARLGEEGVLALLSDSTNVEKEGYTLSDKDIEKVLSSIAAECSGRIIVALFASSISRIQQIVDIAYQTGRKVVFDGKSIQISVGIAKELGFLNIPEGFETDIKEIHDYPDAETLIITTGSQGEPMSALSRMASGTHRHIRIHAGDKVILSSKFIPGNERAITNIINTLYRRGADVIYEKISAIHVSGHAFKEELKLMLQLTRPRLFIPIHGEYRHLVLHSRLAQEIGLAEKQILLAENGQVIELDANSAAIRDRIRTGRVLVDGKGIGDIGKSVLKERRELSEDGFVAVNMAFDEETGIVIYGPEISSKGFIFETETGHLLEDAKCVVLEIVDEMHPEVPNRVERIREMVQSALKKYFDFTIKRRPVILPFILEI
jgi:ribonuclease J